MQLDFEESSVGGRRVLGVIGEIDLASSPQFGRKLHEYIGTFESAFVIDLSAVSFMDSTGLGTLVSGARILAPKSQRLTVVTSQPSLGKVFEITSMGEI